MDINDEFTTMVFQWESKIFPKAGKMAGALQCAKEYEAHAKSSSGVKAFYRNTVLAEIYFANRQFKESLKYANMVANAPARTIKMDYYLFAHLLRICIQYEAKHFDTVDSLIHSISRFMKKENLREPFASCFLQEISNRNSVSGKKRKKITTGKILQELQNYIRPDEEHYELLLSWLKEKS
jgi:ubiquinone/menaquinone biosynthesis C-methylase UbiE